MPVKNQTITENYALYNSDCMTLLPELESESIDLSIYSPPFPELYGHAPCR